MFPSCNRRYRIGCLRDTNIAFAMIKRPKIAQVVDRWLWAACNNKLRSKRTGRSLLHPDARLKIFGNLASVTGSLATYRSPAYEFRVLPRGTGHGSAKVSHSTSGLPRGDMGEFCRRWNNCAALRRPEPIAASSAAAFYYLVTDRCAHGQGHVAELDGARVVFEPRLVPVAPLREH